LFFLVRLLQARPHRHALMLLAGVTGCVLAGEVLTHLVRGEEHRLAEHVVPQGDQPRRLSELRRTSPGLILGVVQPGGVFLGVGEDPQVVSGDVLLVVEPNGTHHPRRHPSPARHTAD
jgi:hypothetical protein